MWQKIKCWLGWHEWKDGCGEKLDYCYWKEHHDYCKHCPICVQKCKHCGKVKR